ncbi:PucR family transcriptional regulator [Streptomyces sp. NPDC090073]|uniref:PucR family transcriptional regulator n=1 Tax=Streptomyces sp. NPDC090073 TaxID=3365936 RepID=UPI0037FE9E01
MSHSTAQQPRDPFERIPPHLTAVFSPLLLPVSEDIVEAIRDGVPEYARPADLAYMKTLHMAVEQALRLFLDRIDNPQGSIEAINTTYEAIGAWEAGEGRSLDAFQLALRRGSRLAWQRVVAHIGDQLLPREHLATLAEALLVHIDDLSAAATRGYLQAGSRQLREVARRRERLVSLLVADPPASLAAIHDLAQACQWHVPRLAAVAVGEESASEVNSVSSIPPDVLVGSVDGAVCLVIPDPEGPGRQAMLRRALKGRSFAIGPSVPITGGADSLRWASDTLFLARSRLITASDLVFSVDHLATLLLFRDTKLLEVLSQRHLDALSSLSSQRRERLAETLLAWLQSGRSVSAVAKSLGIHHQTVRYRMRQLDALYGAKLHDPDLQFELELVLRARTLRRSAAPQ